MNDTCQTTVHSSDSLFSDMEDAGCQSADVPLARNLTAGGSVVSLCRAFCGNTFAFPVFLPDMRAFPVPESYCFDACRCGMVKVPA